MTRPRPFLAYRPSPPPTVPLGEDVELPSERAAKDCPEVASAFSAVERGILVQCSPAAGRITVWADPKSACIKFGRNCGEAFAWDRRTGTSAVGKGMPKFKKRLRPSESCLESAAPMCAASAPQVRIDGEVANAREYAALVIALGQLVVLANKASLYTDDLGTIQALMAMPVDEIQDRIAEGEDVPDDLWRPIALAATAFLPQLARSTRPLPPETKAHLPDVRYLADELAKRFR